MNEFHFVLKDWHVIAALLTIVGWIASDQLKPWIHSLILIREIKFHIGQTIEVMYVDGEWTPVTIKGFKPTIPFRQIGGVLVEHIHSDGTPYTEKLSFTVYHYARKRFKKAVS
ncbi:MAG: hypothetical protein ACPGVU_02615 [Limisphaerales bacterium]